VRSNADPTVAVRLRDGFRHEAVLHRSREPLLARAVPFLAEGVAAGEQVMVQASGPMLALLTSAVDPRARGVRLVDAADLGTNPARCTALWLEFADDIAAHGRPARGLIVHGWPRHRPAVLAEQQVAEALLSVAVGPDTPLWLRCAYDLDRIDSTTLTQVSCAHPVLVQGSIYRGSRRYAGVSHLESLFEQHLPPPRASTRRLAFTQAADLARIRDLVRAQSASAALGADTTSNLTLAVHEIALNALTHGGGRGEVWFWREGAALLCEVQDPGHLSDRLAGRRPPSQDLNHGRGLWLANQLCDLVQIRSGRWGTAIRVTTWL
jgi:anti-sigma regulatory factor (Ser/Thr protein kinase)